jgi:hypothetical protein
MPIQKSRRSSFPPCQDRNQSANAVICVGRRSTLSHQRKQGSRTALASTQPSSKCSMNSWAWSQNGQARGLGKPRHSSRSAV